MPVDIKDCQDGIGVTITGRGVVTDDDLRAELKAHLTQDEEKFSQYRYSLSDYSAATEVHASNETIRYIARLCIDASKMNPHPVVAIVASSDLIYGLSRMAETFMAETQWTTMVFRSRQEAVEWIKNEVRNRFAIEDLTIG